MVKLEDLRDGVVFVSDKVGFALDYLRFFTDLQYRGYVSTASFIWTHRRSFGMETSVYKSNEYGSVMKHLDEMLSAAAFLYVAMQELAPMGLHTDLYIGEDITQRIVTTYSDHLHSSVFPGTRADSGKVREIAIDGHEQVLTKCPGKKSVRRGGRPRTRRAARKECFTNGPLMAAMARSGGLEASS